MKYIWLYGLASALLLSAVPGTAQEAAQVEQLKEQLRRMQESFEQQQRQQQRQLEELRRQIEALRGSTGSPSAAPGNLMEGRLADRSAPTARIEQRPWSPTDPITLLGGRTTYLNLSLDGLITVGGSTARDLSALQPGAHDPNQRGFTLQNLEAAFDGVVDPYFRGRANLIYQIDASGGSKFEVEEAYFETLSLPGSLQLKGGQFFTEFGRHNPTHPHNWAFVDQPLINNRMFGGDGQRNPGARLSWLVPTPFFSELRLAILNGQGETAHSFRSSHEGAAFHGRAHTVRGASALRDFIFAPRYEASWEMTDAQTLLAGVSAAMGANASGTDTETRIFGADLTWKWKPVNHQRGFPFVAWQTEGMLRKYEAGAFSNLADDLDASGAVGDFLGERDLFGNGSIRTVARETLTDYGLYSQLSYGLRPGWVAGMRGDFVAGNRALYETAFGTDPDRDARWRLSPNLTWFPSEFSRVRLQYNYDHRKRTGSDHSLWLQFEFLLGAHGAHKF